METFAKFVEFSVSMLFVFCTFRGIFLEYRRKNTKKAVSSYDSAVAFAGMALLIDLLKLLDGANSEVLFNIGISAFIVVTSVATMVMTAKKIERERTAS